MEQMWRRQSPRRTKVSISSQLKAILTDISAALTAAEIARFEFGSEEQLAARYSYTALIWCMKGTMLCFFNRLT